MSAIISQRAITAFMTKKRDDWTWIKDLSVTKLQAIISEFDPKPRFKTTPKDYQMMAFILGCSFNEFCFFYKTGTGKTKIHIDLVSYKKRAKIPHVSLALVPNVVNIDNWEDEIKKHSNTLKICPLIGTTPQRWKIWDANPDCDIYVINYAGLNAMVSELVPSGRGQKRQREVVPEKLAQIAERIDGLLLDESQWCKNSETLNFDVANRIRETCSFAYLTTGTPSGENPVDFWSQFYLADRGETLTPHLDVYLQAFFHEHFNGFQFIWKFDGRRKKTLNRMLRHRSLFYEGKIEDGQTIPVHFVLRGQARQKYNQALETIRQQEKDIESGLQERRKNLFVLMRQITSGYFSIDPHDKSQSKVLVPFSQNPKMDALMTLLDSFPPTDKVIIFHAYIYTGELIAKALRKAKIKFSMLNGTQSTEMQRSNTRLFRNNKKVRVLVTNWQSGGTGLNLQMANLEVFYETPTAPIGREQAEGRVVRTGQKKPAFLYDLIAKDTVDERINKSLIEGRDIQQAFITDRRVVKEIIKDKLK